MSEIEILSDLRAEKLHNKMHKEFYETPISFIEYIYIFSATENHFNVQETLVAKELQPIVSYTSHDPVSILENLFGHFGTIVLLSRVLTSMNLAKKYQ